MNQKRYMKTAIVPGGAENMTVLTWQCFCGHTIKVSSDLIDYFDKKLKIECVSCYRIYDIENDTAWIQIL